MNIPSPIVEAAMVDLYAGGAGPIHAAAARRLMAKAWDEGEDAGYKNMKAEQWGLDPTPNPYRSQ